MIVAENSSDVTPGATTVKPKILVLLPHISPGKPTYYIDSEKATLCRFINDHTDKYDFILKFHPRQTVEEIREYMAQFTAASVGYVTNVTIFDVVGGVDYAIVVGTTSAIMDILVSGTPVAEFYEGKDNGHYIKIADNVYGTFVRMHDLAPHAETYEELCAIEKNVFAGDGWKEYAGKYREYLSLDNRACERWAREIMRIVKHNNVHGVKLD